MKKRKINTKLFSWNYFKNHYKYVTKFNKKKFRFLQIFFSFYVERFKIRRQLFFFMYILNLICERTRFSAISWTSLASNWVKMNFFFSSYFFTWYFAVLQFCSFAYLYFIFAFFTFSFVSGISLLGTSTEIYVYGTQYAFILITLALSGVISWYIFLPVFCNLQLTSTYEVSR